MEVETIRRAILLFFDNEDLQVSNLITSIKIL